MVPYKHNFGQTITTDVEGTAADRAFIAHLQWSAAQAVATDTDGIFDGIEAEDSTADPAGVAVAATPAADEFVAQPPCARNVTVTVAATTPAHVKAAAITVSGKKHRRGNYYRGVHADRCHARDADRQQSVRRDRFGRGARARR